VVRRDRVRAEVGVQPARAERQIVVGGVLVRGGILSVDAGQTEAAASLGLGRWRVLRRIVVPQAMRSIVPTAGNMLIGTLKGTSIVSVLAVQDLLFSVQLIYNRTYQIIPLLMVATIWYIAVTSVLSAGQFYVERYYARGAPRELPPTPLQRLRRQTAALGVRLRTASAADAPALPVGRKDGPSGDGPSGSAPSGS
jgi:polar amino acid transport system permease protein